MSVNNSEKDNFLDELKKQRQENNKKVERYRFFLVLFETILLLSAYSILIYHNKWIALAIFLLTFGNNLALIRVLFSNKENIIKNIWKYRK